MISIRTWICVSYGKVHAFIIGSYMQPFFMSSRDLLLSRYVHACRHLVRCSRRLACHGISRKLCHGAWFNKIFFSYVAINSVLIKSQWP